MPSNRIGRINEEIQRELADQLRYNTKLREVDGSILLSYRNVFSPSNPVMRDAVGKVLREYWKTPVPCPPCGNVRR